MSRRRNFRRGRAPHFGISTVDLRFGSGTGYRSCGRDFQSARALGRRREIEFHRMPLSRAGVSQPARTGHELFQYLLQLARRTHASALFAPGEPGAIRSSSVDDHGKTDLVHRRISLRNPARFIAHTCNGKEAHPRRSTYVARRNGGAPKKIILLCLGSARASRAGFGVAPKQPFLEFTTFHACRCKEEFVIARTRSPTRETRTLPMLAARGRFGKTRSRRSAETGRARFRRS